MMNDNKRPKLNPILKELHNRGDGDNLATIKGFIGEASEGYVRLYPFLTVPSYMDIRREDIIHFMDATEDDKPTILYVKSSADINYTHIQSYIVKAHNLQSVEERKCDCGCGNQSGVRALRRMNDGDEDWRTDYDCRRDCLTTLFGCLGSGKKPDRCLNDAHYCNKKCDDGIRGGRLIY